MSSAEIMPALAGFVLGALLAWLHARDRRWIAVPLVLLLGVSATIASGEFRISWGFLLIDIPLVAGTAVCGFAAFRLLRSGRRSHSVK